jgi:hypothetical protein
MKVNMGKNFRFGFERNNIYIPFSCRNIPLYFYSFLKQISNGSNLNLFNLLYDSPVKVFIKKIYPNLINLGYKSKKKEDVIKLNPLTVLSLERNQLLIYDDGIYISLLINSEINKRKKEHFFNVFDEKNKKFEFFTENKKILDIIKDKPMKIIFLDDNNILNKKILELFLEDIIVYNNATDYDYIKKKIMDYENYNGFTLNDLSYTNYYEILSGNLFDFFE